MIKVGVIGSSQESIYAIRKAKNQGLYVIGIDGNSDAEGLKYVDKKYVVDIKDELRIIQILKEEGIKAILPVPIGRYLTTIARVNTELDLVGIKEESALYCTDKWYFHELLANQGLRDIVAICGEKSVLLDTSSNVIYPSILKPRYGSGSRDVLFVQTREELEESIEQIGEEEYILEQFVEGEEYGVDGVVINGKLHLILLRKKILTYLPYRQAVGYIGINQEDIVKKVEQFLIAINDLIKLNQTLFHADIIITNEGECFLVEISGRPSGHRLSSEFTRICTGCDMINEFINLMTGREFDFSTEIERSYAIAYFDFENIYIEKIPSKKSLIDQQIPIIEYNCFIKSGEYMKQVKDGNIMKRGYFIISGNNEQELYWNIRRVKQSFTVKREKKSDE